MNRLVIKFGMIATVGLLGFALALPTLAIDATSRGQLQEEFMEKAGSRPGLLRDFANSGRAAIGSGTLTAIGGTTAPTTLTVQGKGGKSYTINVEANTQLRRRFWGKASLSEFTVGDMVNVIGQWTDDTHTVVNARLVRDLSIQKRNGVFIGSVTSLNATGWVMHTITRGDQTVTVSPSTKFVNRRGQTITQADIVVGHRVRVRGLWDRKANTITEVSHVKDYSLPPRGSGNGASTSATVNSSTSATLH